MQSAKYNYSKLLGAIKEHGYTQQSFAQKLGISACSLNLTLHNKRDFRQDEISKASELLKIPASAICDYFFCHSSLEN